MHIYEKADDIQFEEYEKICDRLFDAVPGIDIFRYFHGDSGNTKLNRLCGVGNGIITAKRYPATGSLDDIVVFYHHGIAVVRNDISDKEQTIEALRVLGYRVPSAETRDSVPMVRDGNIVKEWYQCKITPEAILWDEIKNDGNQPIRQNLESLLFPILSSIRGVKEYEFAVYDVPTTFCTDYMPDDFFIRHHLCEPPFRLPANGKGIIDLEPLIDKVRTIPSNAALAISSRVQTENGKMHLPMIDFMTARDIYLVHFPEALERLGIPKNFMVNSGNSYHHYNTQQLLAHEDFIRYLDMLAEQHEIGTDWPQLVKNQGFALLRIAPSAVKAFYPEIVPENELCVRVSALREVYMKNI